jgi:hypothetical protein
MNKYIIFRHGCSIGFLYKPVVVFLPAIVWSMHRNEAVLSQLTGFKPHIFISKHNAFKNHMRLQAYRPYKHDQWSNRLSEYHSYFMTSLLKPILQPWRNIIYLFGYLYVQCWQSRCIRRNSIAIWRQWGPSARIVVLIYTYIMQYGLSLSLFVDQPTISNISNDKVVNENDTVNIIVTLWQVY